MGSWTTELPTVPFAVRTGQSSLVNYRHIPGLLEPATGGSQLHHRNIDLKVSDHILGSGQDTLQLKVGINTAIYQDNLSFKF